MIALFLVAAAFASGAKDIPTLFREARQAEQRRDFATALERYNAVLALDSKIAEVWANQGLVLYELGRHRESLHAFEKAAELKPQLATAQLFRGLEYLRFGEAARGLAALTIALKLDPANARARYAMANAHAELGHYSQAIRLYREVLQQEPDMGDARYALAIAYLNFSKSSARTLLESGSGYGKLLLAEYLAILEATEPAEANYRSALAALPRSPEVREAARAFYLSRKQPEKAEALGGLPPDSNRDPLEPAIALWRKRSYENAFQLFSKGKGERAMYWLSVTCRALTRELLVEGVQRNPDSFQAHLLLADVAKNNADDATAQMEYEKAARLAPGNVEVQLLFIRFLASRDPAAALGSAQQAVARLPANAQLNVELGRLFLKAGDARGAAARFEHLLEQEPSLSNARAGLAEARAAAGEFGLAITQMERAVNGDPDGSWHYRLATWYQKMGRVTEAREAFAATARIKAQQREKEIARFLELTSVLERIVH